MLDGRSRPPGGQQSLGIGRQRYADVCAGDVDRVMDVDIGGDDLTPLCGRLAEDKYKRWD